MRIGGGAGPHHEQALELADVIRHGLADALQRVPLLRGADC